MYCIYLDYAKASDSVVHSNLIAKLSCYGVSGQLLRWNWIQRVFNWEKTLHLRFVVLFCLTLSSAVVSSGYTLPCWCNLHFKKFLTIGHSGAQF